MPDTPFIGNELAHFIMIAQSTWHERVKAMKLVVRSSLGIRLMVYLGTCNVEFNCIVVPGYLDCGI